MIFLYKELSDWNKILCMIAQDNDQFVFKYIHKKSTWHEKREKIIVESQYLLSL